MSAAADILDALTPRPVPLDVAGVPLHVRALTCREWSEAVEWRARHPGRNDLLMVKLASLGACDADGAGVLSEADAGDLDPADVVLIARHVSELSGVGGPVPMPKVIPTRRGALPGLVAIRPVNGPVIHARKLTDHDRRTFRRDRGRRRGAGTGWPEIVWLFSRCAVECGTGGRLAEPDRVWRLNGRLIEAASMRLAQLNGLAS